MPYPAPNGNLTNAPANLALISGGTIGGWFNADAQVIATAGTIALSTGASPAPQALAVAVAPAAAITGVIMEKGRADGQICVVVNSATAANTITFAAVGTSFVADGATTAIAGQTSRAMIWSAQNQLWYKLGG